MVAALLMIPSDIVRACRDAEAVHGAGPLRASSSHPRDGPCTPQSLARGPGSKPGATSAVRGRAAAGPVGPHSKHQRTPRGGPERRYLELSSAPQGRHGGRSGPPPGSHTRHSDPDRAAAPGRTRRRWPATTRASAAANAKQHRNGARSRPGAGSLTEKPRQGRPRSAAPGLPGRHLPRPGAAPRSPGLHPAPPVPASPTCTAPAPLGPPAPEAPRPRSASARTRRKQRHDPRGGRRETEPEVTSDVAPRAEVLWERGGGVCSCFPEVRRGAAWRRRRLSSSSSSAV